MVKARSLLLIAAVMGAKSTSIAMENDVNNIHVIGNKLHFKNQEFECGIGKNGITKDKWEGDNKTPAGEFKLLSVWYRADEDRNSEPIQTNLTLQKITQEDGWCDQSGDPKYNQHVPISYPANKEELWRSDNAYDIFAVINYNIDPIEEKKGSAIFFHVALIVDGQIKPTAGCVSLRKPDLEYVIAHYTPDTKFIIEVP